MRQVKKGRTGVSVTLYIIDNTTGLPKTDLLFNSAGVDLEYVREGAIAVSITEAALASPALTDAWAEGGFLAKGRGSYRLDVPNAAFATGAETVDIQGTFTGYTVMPQTIDLTNFDLDDLAEGIIFGVAETGTFSPTQATTNLTGYANDQLIGAVIIVTSGNAEGERKAIIDYASASGLITFGAMTSAMANLDTFKIV
jgi:hypothetical protein